MITTNFLNQFIYDIINTLEHSLYLDRRGINLYIKYEKTLQKIDVNSYHYLTKDETIILQDFVDYLYDESKFYNALEIPLWSGNVRIKNVVGEGEGVSKMNTSNDKYLFNPEKTDNYKLIYKLDISCDNILYFENDVDFTVRDLLASYISVKRSKYDRTMECFRGVNTATNSEKRLFINFDFE